MPVVEYRDTRAVTATSDPPDVSTDYRLLINRELPAEERASISKSVYVSRRAKYGRTRTAGVHPYRCQYCGGWHLGHRRRPS